MIILPLAGIVAEFNPLHNGHKYLIDCAKRDGNDVVTVISGNFVQRGDTAVIPKFKRAETALIAGADIVVELPVPWSMSTAQNFAYGGISQLAAMGIEVLYFGSESGDINLIKSVANLISSKDFNDALKSRLSCGETFSKIRSDLVNEILGEAASDVLKKPNDTLATEYIIAANKLNVDITFKAVKRIGAGHNDKIATNCFSSSTLIREAMLMNDYDSIAGYIPDDVLKIINNSPVSDIRKLDVAIISRLKQLTADEISNLPDISEGLDVLIYESIRSSHSVDSLLEKIKSKRYTLARIRRILLCGFLGIDSGFFLKRPPYVRILGFNKNGEKYLSCNAGEIPLVTKVSQIRDVNEFAIRVFNAECSFNLQYELSLNNHEKYTDELTQRIIKK